MILCIDAGNTRIKWGLAPNAQGAWAARGALPTASPGELRAQLANHPSPQRVLGCNVAGRVVEAALAGQFEATGLAVEWLRPSAAAWGVANGYRDPAQLGADRWSALIAARGLHDGPAIVVMAGTATTVDLLDADGQFRGGLILPGFDLMRAALARNTAQLPLAQGAAAALPQSTEEAIVSGCLLAQAGAVERMFRHIAHDARARCVLSGGGAAQLAAVLDLPFVCIEDLALEGLRRVAFAPARDGLE